MCRPSLSVAIVLVLVYTMSYLGRFTAFGISANQTKAEFVDTLSTYQLADLTLLRDDLFDDLVSANLVPTDFLGLPMVTRRNTISRSIYKILSEDCWVLLDCLTHNTPIPRSLLKNGKRDKSFVSSQPRPVPCLHPASIQTNSSAVGPTPSSPKVSSDVASHLPSSRSISDHFIARELSTLRNDLDNLKTDFHEKLHRQRTPESAHPLIPEFMCLKDEIKFLHHKLDSISPILSRATSPEPPQATYVAHSNPSHLTITTFNCRGLSNAIPYILHLIENGSDIIALSEHWLWPYNINTLSNIHPDYDGFGYCDGRLTDSCTLTKGCGGVGILWRKSLNAVPQTQIVSERLNFS